MDPVIWLLIGSIFLFTGSTRQAWFEIRMWNRKLESSIGLALLTAEKRDLIETSNSGAIPWAFSLCWAR